jgi:TetR/AcrR family transcriptional regulator, acrAB operon repressor
MVRRTKEDALATREAIMEAAAVLFEQQGVAGTTLQHIATAAGVTRGAIYWHFVDKGALFTALMERARMPMETSMAVLDRDDTDDPLRDLRDCMLESLRMTATDEQMRRMFDICTRKMEMVGEMSVMRERLMDCHQRWMERAESRIRIGIRRGQVRPDVSPQAAALGMWCVMDGLIKIWLASPQTYDLQEAGRQIVDSQIDCLRA